MHALDNYIVFLRKLESLKQSYPINNIRVFISSYYTNFFGMNVEEDEWFFMMEVSTQVNSSVGLMIVVKTGYSDDVQFLKLNVIDNEWEELEHRLRKFYDID